MDEPVASLLKGEDIVAIIQACKDAGVSKFKLGSLKITFGTPEEANQEEIYPTFPQPPAESKAKDHLSEDEATHHILEESLQMLIDPLAYEEKRMESN
jgi:hypothetical protein